MLRMFLFGLKHDWGNGETHEGYLMKLLIVIVSYRVTDLTIDCLSSLSKAVPWVPGTNVVVCENGTGGNAADRLRQAIEENNWGSWVDLKIIYPNRGFTGGNNAVILPALQSHDPPKYVLLLNADTIVQEHALDSLVAFMDSHPKAGIAASTYLSPEGNLRPTAFRFPGIATELDRGLRLGIVSKLLTPWVQASLAPSQACPVEWACTASGILRRTMLEQIGLLDEGLYTYFDDVDICLRAKRAAWETWFVPESQVIHLEGASTGISSQRRELKRRPCYWYQARHRFFTKNYGALYTAMADAAFIIGYSIWRLRQLVHRKPAVDPPYMLIDSIWNSVFFAGSKVRVVENPALGESDFCS
jgi:N-acetylglucosaminyl-diphospho-decaprenol L-rhamnosyltransferase